MASALPNTTYAMPRSRRSPPVLTGSRTWTRAGRAGGHARMHSGHRKSTARCSVPGGGARGVLAHSHLRGCGRDEGRGTWQSFPHTRRAEALCQYFLERPDPHLRHPPTTAHIIPTPGPAAPHLIFVPRLTCTTSPHPSNASSSPCRSSASGSDVSSPLTNSVVSGPPRGFQPPAANGAGAAGRQAATTHAWLASGYCLGVC